MFFLPAICGICLENAENSMHVRDPSYVFLKKHIILCHQNNAVRSPWQVMSHVDSVSQPDNPQAYSSRVPAQALDPGQTGCSGCDNWGETVNSSQPQLVSLGNHDAHRPRVSPGKGALSGLCQGQTQLSFPPPHGGNAIAWSECWGSWVLLSLPVCMTEDASDKPATRIPMPT